MLTATLRLTCGYTSDDGNAHAVTVYGVQDRAWVENEATWSNYASGSAWSTAGGDYYGTQYGTFNVSTQGDVTVDVTQLVNNWVNGTYANRGLGLKMSDAVTLRFWSSDYANYHPRLTVIWDADPLVPTYTPTATPQTGTAVLSPTGDTWMSDTATTTNYGAEDSVYVQRHVAEQCPHSLRSVEHTRRRSGDLGYTATDVRLHIR